MIFCDPSELYEFPLVLDKWSIFFKEKHDIECFLSRDKSTVSQINT